MDFYFHKKSELLVLMSQYISANCSDFYEWEIPDSHRNIFAVKTQSFFVDLSVKQISNNFCCIKMDFRFLKKMGTVGTYAE